MRRASILIAVLCLAFAPQAARGPRHVTLPVPWPEGVAKAGEALKEGAAPAAAPVLGANQFDFPADKIGSTAHVDVWVDPSLGELGKALGKELLKGNRVELHYTRTADFYRVAPASRFRLNLIVARVPTGGAYHYGGLHEVYASVRREGAAYRWDVTSALMVAELGELFAEAQGLHWDDSWDQGEGMSRFVAASVVPKTLDGFETVPSWHNKGAPDFVSKSSRSYDVKAIGCATCFLYYLRWELNYTPAQIIAAGDGGATPTLENVYHKLTGKSGGYKAMMAVLDKRYPRTLPIPRGIAYDNLFDGAVD